MSLSEPTQLAEVLAADAEARRRAEALATQLS
jgi:hypothetical protein